MSVLRTFCGLWALFFACCFGTATYAQNATGEGALSWLGVPANRAEFSSGGDITGTSNSTYGALVIAPRGSLGDDGWRLKLSGARSIYSYTGDHEYCRLARDAQSHGQPQSVPQVLRICDTVAKPSTSAETRAQYAATLAPYGLFIENYAIYYHQTYEVTRYDAAVTPGYQITAGRLVVKGYLGPGYENTRTVPSDRSKSADGTLWGAKGGLEGWLPLGERAWLAADGSYFTASERYSASARLGVKPLEWFTVGPQLAAFGDRDDASTRLGGFLTFEAMGGETTLSGGWTGNYRDDPSLYGAANFYVKF